jgi:hypothetical protein
VVKRREMDRGEGEEKGYRGVGGRRSGMNEEWG